MSYVRTTILLAGLTGLFLVVGFLIGGQTGMMIALMIGLATNLFAYWNSDTMVLSMYGARQIDRADMPEFWDMVAQLAERAGLPMPKVFVIDNPQPNAFATGRDPAHASVAATTGLLRILDPEEVAGVMAHELAHVKNRDTLVMTIAATIAGAIGMLAQFGLFFGGGSRDDERGGGTGLGVVGVILAAVLAPMAAMLVQMAISRTREYAADRAGAEICGRPGWLASALGKLEAGAHAVPNPAAERNPATAHLFIVNPLSGGGLRSLFSTHPAMEERIRRLHEMERPEVRRRGPWG